MLSNHNLLLCQEGSARYLAAHLGNGPGYWHQYLVNDLRRKTANREFFRSRHRRPGSFSGYSFYALDNLAQHVKSKKACISHVGKAHGDQWFHALGSLNSFAYVGAEFSFGGQLQVLQTPSYEYIIHPELAMTFAVDLIIKANFCDKYIYDYDKWEVVETMSVPNQSKVLKLLADSGKSMRQRGEA